MSSSVVDALITVGLGALFTVPAVLLGFWLQKTRKAPNRWIASGLMSVAVVLFKLLWVAGMPYGFFVFLIVLASTLGVYRMDIYWSVHKQAREEEASHPQDNKRT